MTALGWLQTAAVAIPAALAAVAGIEVVRSCHHKSLRLLGVCSMAWAAVSYYLLSDAKAGALPSWQVLGGLVQAASATALYGVVYEFGRFRSVCPPPGPVAKPRGRAV